MTIILNDVRSETKHKTNAEPHSIHVVLPTKRQAHLQATNRYKRWYIANFFAGHCAVKNGSSHRLSFPRRLTFNQLFTSNYILQALMRCLS